MLQISPSVEIDETWKRIVPAMEEITNTTLLFRVQLVIHFGGSHFRTNKNVYLRDSSPTRNDRTQKK